MTGQALPLLILGAGGHAKVLLEVLSQERHKIIGVTTPHLDSGTDYLGLAVIGSDEAIFEYDTQEVLLINGIGSLPGRQQRRNLSVTMRERGYRFGSVIHPNSIIASDVLFSEGVQLMAGTIIQPGCKVGQDSIINTGVIVDHDCKIGENCNLSPGVVCSGNVIIESGVYVGAGSTIIQNLSIGKNTIISSGSSIYRDVENDVVFIQPKDEKNTKI